MESQNNNISNNLCFLSKYGCEGTTNIDEINQHMIDNELFHASLINFHYSKYSCKNSEEFEYLEYEEKKKSNEIENTYYYYDKIINEETNFGKDTNFYIPISYGFHFIDNQAILIKKEGKFFGRYPINKDSGIKYRIWKFGFNNIEMNECLKTYFNNDDFDFEIGIEIINKIHIGHYKKYNNKNNSFKLSIEKKFISSKLKNNPFNEEFFFEFKIEDNDPKKFYGTFSEKNIIKLNFKKEELMKGFLYYPFLYVKSNVQKSLIITFDYI